MPKSKRYTHIPTISEMDIFILFTIKLGNITLTSIGEIINIKTNVVYFHITRLVERGMLIKIGNFYKITNNGEKMISCTLLDINRSALQLMRDDVFHDCLTDA